MKQIEYNLLEERWMRVRGQDYTVQEVSLPDALLHAHEYRDLAGELPTQDAAMLAAAVGGSAHGVFRVDGNGTPAPFEETDDALIRWEELYRLGHFPEAPIRAYLEEGGAPPRPPHPTPLLAGAGSEERHRIHRFQADRGTFLRAATSCGYSRPMRAKEKRD